jgi:hypothetical protein
MDGKRVYNIANLVCCACVLFCCVPNLAAAVDVEVTLFKRLAMQVIFLWFCPEFNCAASCAYGGCRGG